MNTNSFTDDLIFTALLSIFIIFLYDYLSVSHYGSSCYLCKILKILGICNFNKKNIYINESIKQKWSNYRSLWKPEITFRKPLSILLIWMHIFRFTRKKSNTKKNFHLHHMLQNFQVKEHDEHSQNL